MKVIELRRIWFSFFSTFLVGGAVGLSTPAIAADVDSPLILIEADGVAITALDLQAELQRAPADVRASILFRKDAVSQLASNLLMRRVLAKQAETSGLAKNAVNQAAIQLGRDRVLSDLQLTRLDDLNKPSLEVLEQRARDIYNAEPKRFETPEEVHAAHILISESEEHAEDKAKAILADLKAGADFGEVAKSKSQDPGSASKGGDLGFFGKGRMAKPFEDAAFALKSGEISEVIKTQFGYHIIKVEEHRPAGKKPFELVSEGLIKEIQAKVLSEGRIKAGEKIMSKAKAHPERLDAFIASQQKP